MIIVLLFWVIAVLRAEQLLNHDLVLYRFLDVLYRKGLHLG